MESLPPWFVFHISDMLYLFKQVPTDPIIDPLDEETPGMV